jgi:ferritin-like metal-binding protein YciE
MPLDQHLVSHLQELYATEASFCGYLDRWVERISNAQLKSMVAEEISGIQDELGNLKTALNVLDAAPMADVGSPLVDAFRQEDTQIMQAMPSALPVDMDVHLVLSEIAFDHLEIGLYQGAIALAKEIGQDRVVDLLKTNLESEHDDLKELQQLLPRLTRAESGGQMAA